MVENNLYDNLRIKLFNAENEIKDIISILERTEEHKKFEKIFGESQANDCLYGASMHLRNVHLRIRNEIKHQEEGML